MAPDRATTPSVSAGPALTVLYVAPFSERTKNEHGDDAHAGGGDCGADERADAALGGALAAALHAYEAVTNESSGKSAKDDGAKCCSTRGGGGKSRERSRFRCVRHGAIVGGLL